MKTHPDFGYRVDELPGAAQLVGTLSQCREEAARRSIRLTFHPDQFVVLSSPREEVVAGSLAEIEYQAEAAELIGADVINIHAGGVYESKLAALQRLVRSIDRLSDRARQRLTLENDDKLYSPSDLLGVCRREGVPLAYDVHHHRCLGDGLSVPEATEAAAETWNREPLVHISSPKGGWGGGAPRSHADYVDIADFPDRWHDLLQTVEVEAKAKELAIERLRNDLAARIAGPARRGA